MQTGNSFPDLSWFALSMSLGIISISAYYNGLETLSLGFLYTDIVAILALTGWFLIMVLKTHNRPTCQSTACRYGLFSAVAAASILAVRLSYSGIEIPWLYYMLLSLFLLAAFLISKPSFPLQIWNEMGKIDTSLSIFPISMLSVAIATSASGMGFQAFASVLGTLSIIIFFVFQGRLMASIFEHGLEEICASGALFINFGFPALSAIFFHQLSNQVLIYGMLPIHELLILLSVILWSWATVLFPVMAAIYLASSSGIRFATSKLAMVFPIAVYSVSASLLSSKLGTVMETISLAFLFSSIAVLAVLAMELTYSRTHF